MQKTQGGTESGPLSVLRLLADAATAEEYQQLLESARGADVEGEYESAVALGLEVHERIQAGHQRESAASALIDVARELATPFEFDDLLQVITRRTRHLLGLDVALVALSEEQHGPLRGHAANGHTSALWTGLEFAPDQGLAGIALAERAPAWTSDYPADPALRSVGPIEDFVRAEGLRGVVAVPLQYGTQLLCSAPIGILYGASRVPRTFGVDERSLIGAVGNLAGLAIENARLQGRSAARIQELEQRLSAAQADATLLRGLVDGHEQLLGPAVDGDATAFAAAAGRRLNAVVQVVSVDGASLTGPAGREDGPVGADVMTDVIADVAEAVASRAVTREHEVIEPIALRDGIWAAPVLTARDHLGAVLVHSSTPPDRRTLAVVVRIAAVLLRPCRTAPGGQQAGREILDELLSPRTQVAGRLDALSRRAGLWTDEPKVVVIAEPGTDAPGRAAIWGSGYARRLGGLSTVHDGRVVLLLPGTDPGAAARAAAADLSRVLDAPGTAGGANLPDGEDAVREAFQEAQRCLYATTALGVGDGGAASARELGFLGVMLSGTHDVQAFIDSAIGPVLRYDEEKLADLTKTMDAYFACGQSPTRAAERLHVHTNTVGRRLDRIKALLGADWHAPERALDIQLALQLHRVRDAIVAPGAAPAGL